jgi:hypothetical protein
MTGSTPLLVLAEAADYMQLVEALRARAEELAITRLEIDEIAGTPEGWASKVLTLSTMKALGLRSLGPILGALALKIVLVEDGPQRERVSKRVRHSHVNAGQRRLTRKQRAAILAAAAT